MAQVGQVQLVQPVLSILWAGLLLGEQITWTTILGGLVVVLGAGAAVRVRLSNAADPPPAPEAAVELPATARTARTR